MKTSIDMAGRLVIPKALRDQAGIRPGQVEVYPDGSGLHIEPAAGEEVSEEAGRLVIPASGAAVDAASIKALIDAGRR